MFHLSVVGEYTEHIVVLISLFEIFKDYACLLGHIVVVHGKSI